MTHLNQNYSFQLELRIEANDQEEEFFYNLRMLQFFLIAIIIELEEKKTEIYAGIQEFYFQEEKEELS